MRPWALTMEACFLLHEGEASHETDTAFAARLQILEGLSRQLRQASFNTCCSPT